MISRTSPFIFVITCLTIYALASYNEFFWGLVDQPTATDSDGDSDEDSDDAPDADGRISNGGRIPATGHLTITQDFEEEPSLFSFRGVRPEYFGRDLDPTL